MTDTPIPMPRETVQWVHALLSGNYKQTKGRLCEIRPAGASYCCLGVAAKILDAFAGQRETSIWDEENGGYIPIAEAYVADRSQVGGQNADVLGMDLWNELRSDALGLNDQSELANANDKGASFAQIVDDYILPAFNLNRATFEEIYGPVPQQS